MRIKFKSDEQTFKTTSFVENKLYRGGEAIGWVISMSLQTDMISSDLDSLLSVENIGEIKLVSESEESLSTKAFIGYNKVTSCSIKYADTQSTAEIQLFKGV